MLVTDGRPIPGPSAPYYLPFPNANLTVEQATANFLATLSPSLLPPSTSAQALNQSQLHSQTPQLQPTIDAAQFSNLLTMAIGAATRQTQQMQAQQDSGGGGNDVDSLDMDIDMTTFTDTERLDPSSLEGNTTDELMGSSGEGESHPAEVAPKSVPDQPPSGRQTRSKRMAGGVLS